MKTLKKWIFLLLIIVAIHLTGCSFLNRFQKEGNLHLSGLKEPVTILRDNKGMAYIYAQNKYDALMAQGFVTAQDRLFQMELTKLFATGRISELAGEKGKAIDIRMRTIGLYRNAKKHAEILDKKTRLFFQKYLDGVNAYIKTRSDTHHLEFRLAGIKPAPWTIADSLAIAYYMGWDSAANLHTEIITQMLVEKVGLERAIEIFPLNINPDDSSQKSNDAKVTAQEFAQLYLATDKKIMSYVKDGTLRVGSNNWAVGPLLSANGKPIVANDPHLDARILPGPWYPIGIITPEFRAVGVIIPGTPGMVVGRTDHIAIGVTNAYGDAQDLYVETVDPENPNRYLEGKKSLPFEVIEETLTIKDKDAPQGYRKEKVKIRLTRRGPVISGVLPGLKTNKVITIRWSAFETMEPSIGLDQFLTATSVNHIREALSHINLIMLNFVFADTDGNIGWQVSSKLPIRSQGDGTIPYVVKDSYDNWAGWIPFDDMPQLYNPQKGWVGTCNHKTVGMNYPYYYSSTLSPSYRYQRLKQLLNSPGNKSVDEHWQFQRDIMNLMAKKIAPVIARALITHNDTKQMGQILSQWDYLDDIDKAAPTIFQAIYRKFALLVFQDELGEELATTMLDEWDFWEEKLQKMVLNGISPWFDNVHTKDIKETVDKLLHQAALDVTDTLGESLGKDPNKWAWGKVHQLELVSPIRREGFGKGLVGGGSHPFPGSGETLCRGIYDFNDPFGVTISASLRMVADLGDDDKVLAVLPGGVSGRLFYPHTKDQIKAFMSGKKVYWWFSDTAIQAHSKTTLVLSPQ
ncbi:MAG: penicillin acylase family protein [Deltaproteobacteria bacterium]|nr:penicillin acylase family protein [Deltaproteobacteria bacterium]